MLKLGPVAKRQFLRLGKAWNQGEHILISGATGSGKTELASHVINLRAQRGGCVIVFCFKPKEDKTIEDSYLKNGYVRWKRWNKYPRSYERKIVLWPDVRKYKGDYRLILAHQKAIFEEAFQKVLDAGHWTVMVDEGLYLTHPTFLGMQGELAMAHAIGRSGRLTLVTLTQRPSHLPLILYSSADHGFFGSTREESDKKRLAELGARESSKELAARIADQGKHDFLWVPARSGKPAEPLNLAQ